MLLGAVPYINAIPLIRGLSQPVRKASPAALDRLLRIGEVDIATAPITTLFENSHWRALPYVAIGTKKAAKSVALFTRNHNITIENVQSISIDTDSRSSALLLRVLLALKHGRDLNSIHFTSPPPDSTVEAQLIIGDRALQERMAPTWEGEIVDLGLEWTEWTGLPFVFACWISTKDSIDSKLIEDLRRRADHNLQTLDDWCHEVEGFDASFLREYFTENMNYDFGRKEQQGLMTFYQHLRELDIQQRPFELHFTNP